MSIQPILFVLAISVLLVASFVATGELRERASYREAPARVQKVTASELPPEVVATGGATPQLDTATIGYEVEGEIYTLDYTRPARASVYQPGDRQTVYYNPADPQRAVVGPADLNIGNRTLLITLGIVALGLLLTDYARQTFKSSTIMLPR